MDASRDETIAMQAWILLESRKNPKPEKYL
jgi:hypothetical protein